MKTEFVHARINENIKQQSEEILKRIGISVSQAIDLFLRQVVIRKGMPFELIDIEETKTNEIERLAYAINSVDGKEPSQKSKSIIHLYANGDIDYETEKICLLRGLKNE